jgi:hypothetical protein
MNPLGSFNGALTIIAALVTLGYTWSCAVFPYKACRACRGYGKFRSSFLGAIRLCRACRGTGLTLRVGRRLYNAIARTSQKFQVTRRRNRRNDNH